jgi:apolipoprotein N-acyltransferase
MPIRFGFLILSALLLAASFAPYEQFYLAWIGLVPWLLAVRRAKSWPRAFGWGWLGGAFFFGLNLVWLARATIPGAIGLTFYLALFWGFVAAVIHLSGLLHPRVGSRASAVLAPFAIAAVWVAGEWLRATLLTGMPWVPLGQSQSPLLAMCQIADITGIYGVIFWLVSVNALLAMLVARALNRAQSLAVGASVAALVIGCALYGIFRLSQATTFPGPRVMVVQPNFRHERGGARTVTQEQQIEFHLVTTEKALSTKPADVVVWSETVMPPLNAEARFELRNDKSGEFLTQIDRQLADFARRHNVALVSGAYYVGGWKPVEGKRTGTDIRNAVYVYHPDGSADSSRYDKIHLVPFGEFLPFRESAPRVYNLLRYFAAYSVDYPIIAASPDALTVFEIQPSRGGEWTEPARFVTPICFEDMDGALLARMFRPGADGRKRADLIINVTNDGWFLGNEQAQHLQSAIFRSIENRAPTARADNTGISGFIDSYGRITGQSVLPVHTDGTLMQRVMLDGRISIYSRVGDVFAWTCLAATAVLIVIALIRKAPKRAYPHPPRQPQPAAPAPPGYAPSRRPNRDRPPA